MGLLAAPSTPGKWEINLILRRKVLADQSAAQKRQTVPGSPPAPAPALPCFSPDWKNRLRHSLHLLFYHPTQVYFHNYVAGVLQVPKSFSSS